MDPYLKALAKAILGGMLPYPDSRRRRRVRRAARALVVCEPWPSDSENTGPDAAQLALLRVLYLQKQTRRVVNPEELQASLCTDQRCFESAFTES